MTARVLVVDDLEPNVKLLEAKLRAEYFDVLAAYSGAEAIEIAQREQPDIILLDVMMPVMDGFEACRRLKASPDTMHIPIVMVTALTDTEDRSLSFDPLARKWDGAIVQCPPSATARPSCQKLNRSQPAEVAANSGK